MTTPLEQAVQILPQRLRSAVLVGFTDAEELHLRAGRPFTAAGQDGQEQAVLRCNRPIPVTGEDLRLTLELATRASYHTAQSKLCVGFLPLRGGHRLGITGTADVRSGVLHGYQALSSLCLRIAHPVQNMAAEVVQQVFPQRLPISTLILSPPGRGKTTLLRELVRLASNRYGIRTGLADERGELAALWNGVPQFDVGERTDVLDGCPKAEALLVLLRTMNPQLLAADEITAPEDIAALSTAANCGVPVLATAHGSSVDELRRRPLYRALMEECIFQQVVLITRDNAGRHYQVRSLNHG